MFRLSLGTLGYLCAINATELTRIVGVSGVGDELQTGILDTPTAKSAWDSWFTEKTYPDRFSSAKIEASSPQALDPVCPTVLSPKDKMFLAAFSSRPRVHPH